MTKPIMKTEVDIKQGFYDLDNLINEVVRSYRPGMEGRIRHTIKCSGDCQTVLESHCFADFYDETKGWEVIESNVFTHHNLIYCDSCYNERKHERELED